MSPSTRGRSKRLNQIGGGFFLCHFFSRKKVTKKKSSKIKLRDFGQAYRLIFSFGIPKTVFFRQPRAGQRFSRLAGTNGVVLKFLRMLLITGQ